MDEGIDNTFVLGCRCGYSFRYSEELQLGHIMTNERSFGSRLEQTALPRETLRQFGGKGGGAKDFAEGSLPDAAKGGDEIAFARKLLESS